MIYKIILYRQRSVAPCATSSIGQRPEQEPPIQTEEAFRVGAVPTLLSKAPTRGKPRYHQDALSIKAMDKNRHQGRWGPGDHEESSRHTQPCYAPAPGRGTFKNACPSINITRQTKHTPTRRWIPTLPRTATSSAAPAVASTSATASRSCSWHRVPGPMGLWTPSG